MSDPGQHVFKFASGGGGFGDPHERDRERVLADVRNGVISKEIAESQYGVTF